MGTLTQPTGLRGLSIGSIVFGSLGGVFFWWVPLGLVLSLAGLVIGLIDVFAARRRSPDHRLAIVGALISLVFFGLDLAVAALGLQLVTFGG